ncbi:CatB-related O-acetyltransferase [Trichocoleus sp. FACHB-90]|uniref:CatB-related O-acetyltransferase n=1 Tax=Cyanophyceae TaxID=3028117 RepID=UPI001683B4B1|nr:CatB-related O-acetyltransferase [Trichocoleus sp. FACHB-90]MBD1929115.1 CatB-related O-acetyltransferase [Trichocoleus sp. FACHB-90]
MTYYEYLSPSSEWLAPKIEDSRITVGDHTYASSRIKFALWNPEEKIQIGKFCSFAKDVIIFGGGEHFISRATTYPLQWFLSETKSYDRNLDGTTKGTTVIENDVWIGYEATIMSGVKIGNGAVIGAKAVVAKDIPDYAIAIGNPAKVIRYRFKPETIARLLELRWWDWDIQKITANMDLLYTNPDNWPQDLHFL